jgi:hypothetical protein
MFIAHSLSNGSIGSILNLKNVGMSYVNYERDIVTRYKIKLIGWPPAVKFASPSEIGTVDDIRLLRQALIVGDCKWMVQTRRQQQAHLEALAARVAAGEVIGKKRKQRSDKGKTRKKSSRKGGKAGEKHGDEDMDTENEDIAQKNVEKHRQPPRKKRKTAAAERMLPFAARIAFKSHEFIDESEDDSEGED